MIRNQLYPYIEKYINEYLYGFTKEQLDIGVMNGSLKLEYLNLRPDKINSIMDEKNQPFWLKAGLISKISVEASLMNFIGERPLEIEINGIDVILTPSYKWIIKNINNYIVDNVEEYKNPYDHRDNNSINIFKKKVSVFDSSIFGKQKTLNIYKDKSKISEILNKLFKGLYKFYYMSNFAVNVKIKNIHIRFEDDQLINYTGDIAFGMRISEIQITLNSDGLSKKDSFKLSDMNLYVENKAKILISSSLLNNSLEDGKLNESYYKNLKKINFQKFKYLADTRFILQNFNCYGNFGIKAVNKDNMDIFSQKQNTYKVYLQFASGEININIFPELLIIKNNFTQFLNEFKILEQVQDLKPLRKPFDKTNPNFKAFQSLLINPGADGLSNQFNHKRKMIVRDWIYYFYWCNKSKTTLMNSGMNPLTLEFSRFFSLCFGNFTPSSNNEKKDEIVEKDAGTEPKKEENPNPNNVNIALSIELLLKQIKINIHPTIYSITNDHAILTLKQPEIRIFLDDKKFDVNTSIKHIGFAPNNIKIAEKVMLGSQYNKSKANINKAQATGTKNYGVLTQEQSIMKDLGILNHNYPDNDIDDNTGLNGLIKKYRPTIGKRLDKIYMALENAKENNILKSKYTHNPPISLQGNNINNNNINNINNFTQNNNYDSNNQYNNISNYNNNSYVNNSYFNNSNYINNNNNYSNINYNNNSYYNNNNNINNNNISNINNNISNNNNNNNISTIYNMKLKGGKNKSVNFQLYKNKDRYKANEPERINPPLDQYSPDVSGLSRASNLGKSMSRTSSFAKRILDSCEGNINSQKKEINRQKIDFNLTKSISEFNNNKKIINQLGESTNKFQSAKNFKSNNMNNVLANSYQSLGKSQIILTGQQEELHLLEVYGDEFDKPAVSIKYQKVNYDITNLAHGKEIITDAVNVQVGTIRLNLLAEYISSILTLLKNYQIKINKAQFKQIKNYVSGIKLYKYVLNMKKYILSYIEKLPGNMMSNQMFEYMEYLKNEVEKGKLLESQSEGYEINFFFSLLPTGIEIFVDYENFECVYYDSQNKISGKAQVPPLGLLLKLSNEKICLRFFDCVFELDDIRGVKKIMQHILKIAEDKLKGIQKIFIEPCLLELKSKHNQGNGEDKKDYNLNIIQGTSFKNGNPNISNNINDINTNKNINYNVIKSQNLDNNQINDNNLIGNSNTKPKEKYGIINNPDNFQIKTDNPISRVHHSNDNLFSLKIMNSGGVNLEHSSAKNVLGKKNILKFQTTTETKI